MQTLSTVHVEVTRAKRLLQSLDTLRTRAEAALSGKSIGAMDTVLHQAVQLGITNASSEMDASCDDCEELPVRDILRKVARLRLESARLSHDAAEALRKANQPLAQAIRSTAQSSGIPIADEVDSALQTLASISPSAALRLRLERASRSGSVGDIVEATMAAKREFFKS